MVGNFNLKNALGGLVSAGIPFVFKGMINTWLTEQEIDVPKACQWVIQNKNMLVLFKEYGGNDFENALDRAGTYVKDPSWLTSEWLIDACRDEHGDIASLFLGWDQGRVWLDIQTEKLRDAFNQQVNHIAPPAVVENIPPVAQQEERNNVPVAPQQRTPNAPPASYKPIRGSENFEGVEVRSGKLI